MIIRELYVDGFGLFHDFSLTGLSRGLQVFLGANEAGKSTLVVFIRRMFFGFPTRTRAANHYEPAAGGRHGGRLTVELRDGRVVRMERRPGPRGGRVTLTVPEGPTEDGEKWSALLQPATRELFETVYAFGLGELQDFKTLNQEGIQSRIYGVGFGLGGASLTDAQAALKKESDDLFRSSAQKPMLNRLFSQLARLDGEIRDSQKVLASFAPQREELENMRAEFARQKAQRERLLTRTRELEALQRAYKPYLALREAKAELAEMPVIDEFPPEGTERLERLLGKVEQTGEELANKTEKRRELEAEIEQTKPDERLLNHRADVEALTRDLGQYQRWCEDLPVRENELAGSEQRLQEFLGELGPDWTEDSLREFDRSLAAEEQVARFEDRFATARATFQAADMGVEQVQEEVNRRQKELDRLDKLLASQEAPEPPEMTRWEARREALRRLRVLLPERDDIRRRLEDVSSHLDELEDRRDHLESEAPPSSLPWWPVPVLGILGIVAGVWGVVTVGPTRTDRFLLAGFLLVAAGYQLWRYRVTAQRSADWRDRQDAQLMSLLQHLERQHENRAGLREQLDSLNAEIAEAAMQANLGADCRLSDVEAQEATAAAAVTALRERARLEEDRRSIFETLSEAEEELNQRRRQRTDAAHALEEVEASWKQWLKEHNLDDGLSPQVARSFFERVQTALTRVDQVQRLRKETAEIRAGKHKYEKTLQELVGALGRPVPPEPSPQQVVALAEELRDVEQAKSRLEAARRALRELTNELNAHQRTFTRAREQLTELVSEAGAESPEEFRRRADLFARRTKLREEVRVRTEEIQNLVGANAFAATCATLANFDPRAAEKERATMHEQLQALDRRITEQAGDIRSREDELKRLAGSEDLAELLDRRERTVAAIESTAARWAVAKLALELLDRARQVYERTRQPEVIRRASQRFAQITGKRYARIVSPLGGAEVRVETPSGGQAPLAHLSRGTQEQLYLALRFGLIEEFDQHGEPLPVVMDDTLVNFDPERARRAAAELLDFARERQVLFFTCHPAVVDCLRDLDSSLRVWTLTAAEPG